MYSETNLPQLIEAKSSSIKKAFLNAYNSALDKGLSHSEAEFSAYNHVRLLEKSNKPQVHKEKAKIPNHLAAVLQKRQQPIEEPEKQNNQIRQEFLGKNALVSNPDRSLVSADFNAKNQLVLQFDTGENITTKPLNVDETIENYVNISQSKIQGPEPTGFVNRTDSQLAFNNATRTFSISPVSQSYIVWLGGAEVNKTTTESVVIPNTSGLYYIYFDVDDTTLKYSGTYTSALLSRQAMVSILYWQVDQQQAIYFADERHGMLMDGVTQAYLHQTNGTVYRNGLDLTNILVDQTGALTSHAQFGVADGRIADEDIDISITNNSPQVLSTIARIPVFYRVGSSNSWYKTTADNYPLLLPGDSPSYSGTVRPAYNYSNSGVWELAQVANNAYFLVHVIATNNIQEPIIAVLGGTYANKPAVQTAAKTELLSITGLPFAEFLPIATVLYQAADSIANVTKAKLVSTDTGSSYIDWRDSSSLSSSSSSGSGAVDIETGLNGLGLASDTLPTEFIVKQGGLWVRATLAQVQSWIDISIDGGSASSVYLNPEVINGGNANG